MFYFLSSLALAGTFTDAPGALQGDIAIQNDFLQTNDTLYQQDTIIGSRTLNNNNLNIAVLFGVIDLMSVELVLPIGNDSVAFQNISTMQLEPLQEMGTYINTPSAEDYRISGSGLEGVELGLHFYPFHRKIFNNRGDQGNWSIGLVYRSPDNSNFFSPSEEGKRGSGLGAQGFGVKTAFSKRQRYLEPYLQVKAMQSSDWTGPIRSNSGETLAKEAIFSPASTVDVRGGTEFFLWEDIAFASYASLDVFGEYHYQSFQNIPSGIYLPSVLPSSESSLTTQTELISFQGGLGTNLQLNSLYGLRVAGKVGFNSPQRIEHFYEVNSLNSFQWGIFTELKIRYRTTAS